MWYQDLPQSDRRKCEKALVQGMLHHENMVLQKADCTQDMHYADFAEDDVGFIEQINFGGEADS